MINQKGKKFKILAFIFLLIGVLCVGFGGFLLISKPEQKKDFELPINEGTRYFTCTRDSVPMKGYKIDYEYKFYVTDGEIKNGTLYFIYTFDKKQDYDSFHEDFSYTGASVEEDFDEKRLIKKYLMNVILSKSNDSIEKYLKDLDSQGYYCLDNTNKK